MNAHGFLQYLRISSVFISLDSRHMTANESLQDLEIKDTALGC